MLRLITDKKRKEENHKFYDEGLNRGYALGRMMDRAEATNRGFIIGSKVNKELEDILKQEKF